MIEELAKLQGLALTLGFPFSMLCSTNPNLVTAFLDACRRVGYAIPR